MIRPVLALLTASTVLASAAVAQPAPDIAGAAAVRERALADGTALELTRSLTTEVGPRIGGSPGYRRAAAWAVRRLNALGFRNVHEEEFAVGVWTRGEERAAIIGEHAQPLTIAALGGSVATPAQGIEAELAVFGTWAEFMATSPGALTGRIAVVLQPTARTQDGSGYGAAGAIRREGPSEAARRGAVAYLHRSLGTEMSRNPHTGSTRYADGVGRIPAAALSTVDAEQIGRLAALGRPLRVRLTLTPTFDPDGRSTNVVGEIPGRGRLADEVILIGGHLDAWDLGTGAIDDATGVAATTAAARLVAQAPGRGPRRTIRVVLYGAEETGPAGEAYATRNAATLNRIVLASEADYGDGPVWRARLPGGLASQPFGLALSQALAPLGAFLNAEPARQAGADITALERAGVPVFNLALDGTDYFDWHHTAEDTFDKVNPRDLAQMTAAWATLVYLATTTEDVDFRAAAAAGPAAPAGR